MCWPASARRIAWVLEASLKYVLFAGFAGDMMIYGLSLLYGMFGTLQLDGTFGIAAQIATTQQPLRS